MTWCQFCSTKIPEKVRKCSHYRENYRLYNEGKQGFIERMGALDERILKSIDKVSPVMKEAQEYLDKIHKWKVRGAGFYIDENFVTNIMK